MLYHIVNIILIRTPPYLGKLLISAKTDPKEHSINISYFLKITNAQTINYESLRHRFNITRWFFIH